MRQAITERIENLKDFVVIGLLGLILGSSSVGLTLLVNRNNKYLGEGYVVRETGNQRQFYIGTYCGVTRLCIDKNKDGTLDEVWVNMPISAFMGGPGYRLMSTKPTEEDSKRFERANYLLNLQSHEEPNQH